MSEQVIGSEKARNAAERRAMPRYEALIKELENSSLA